MYNKIMYDLKMVDPNNVGLTKKILGKIHSQMQYFIKKNDINGLRIIIQVLEDFLSTNRSRFYIEEQDGNPYKVKRFLQELEYFLKLCKLGLVT